MRQRRPRRGRVRRLRIGGFARLRLRRDRGLGTLRLLRMLWMLGLAHEDVPRSGERSEYENPDREQRGATCGNHAQRIPRPPGAISCSAPA